ncbi:MAG: alpha/beta hydrolase [Sphingobacteriales bacterium]|nr:alpha/beta hydrolase [Sphingobacteriales bacterium]
MKLAQKIAIGYIRTKLNLLAVVSKRKAAEKALEIFSTPYRKVKKKNPPVFEKAEKLSFKMDGYTIRGFRWNHDAKTERRKVLILHGFESTVKNFERYINPLLKKNYEILAFDAPAHGDSSGKYLNLPIYIKTIEAVINKYGPVQSFMAHSFGGMAIIHYLEKHKHNSDYRIALIAPATETITAVNYFFNFLKLSEDIKSEFNKLIEERAGIKPENISIRRAAKHIKANILWFHDEEDDITPLSDAIKVKEDNHPNIHFVITKGLGHRRIYRDPNVSKQIVDFL